MELDPAGLTPREGDAAGRGVPPRPPNQSPARRTRGLAAVELRMLKVTLPAR
ncbi:hypothetical protein SAMN05421833_10993 [Microbispora rosea]|uniref:Uncharacterized protein n=1 Tax=Microbispora rosea TaxID=58117 RepID=A0A1N7B1R5_9ACTN|nr:hypothetical protein SAMN05421833_10993 [Microbispora rosea]